MPHDPVNQSSLFGQHCPGLLNPDVPMTLHVRRFHTNSSPTQTPTPLLICLTTTKKINLQKWKSKRFIHTTQWLTSLPGYISIERITAHKTAIYESLMKPGIHFQSISTWNRKLHWTHHNAPNYTHRNMNIVVYLYIHSFLHFFMSVFPFIFISFQYRHKTLNIIIINNYNNNNN